MAQVNVVIEGGQPLEDVVSVSGYRQHALSWLSNVHRVNGVYDSLSTLLICAQFLEHGKSGILL